MVSLGEDKKTTQAGILTAHKTLLRNRIFTLCELKDVGRVDGGEKESEREKKANITSHKVDLCELSAALCTPPNALNHTNPLRCPEKRAHSGQKAAKMFFFFLFWYGFILTHYCKL